MKNDNAVQHNNQTASEQTLSPDEGHVLHKVRDPVCGMAILPDRAHSSIRYQDHQLYFCSASCESKFKAHSRHDKTLLAGVVAGVSGSGTRNGISSVSRLEEYSTATVQHMAAVASGLPCRVVVWLAILRPGRNVVT